MPHDKLMSTEFDDAELARRLRAAMKLKRVSVRALSEHLNIPYKTLHNYLSGSQKIPAVFLLRACHLLYLDPSYLIYGTFKPFRPDLYDAVYSTLDEHALMPALPRPTAPEWASVASQRVAFAAHTAASIEQKYEMLQHQRLEKSRTLNLAAFGRRSLSDK